jgi:ankyrin repeat protein
VASENIAIVERLLQAGAEVNAPASERGHTAIQVAARCGNLTIVERLLQAGADVNAPAAPTKGHTAIQAAAIFGNLATVERLLQAGADFNAPATTWGNTALQGVAISENLTIVERLLEAGADVNVPGANCEGYTAYSQGYTQCYTAIQAAAYLGNIAITERLLQAGADANDRGSCNKSSLEIAEMRGNIETVNLLSGLVPNRSQVPTRTIPTPAMTMSSSWFLRSDIYSAVAAFR